MKNLLMPLLVVLACLSVGIVQCQPSVCCSQFTPTQKGFLRTLLQEEAKGLRAGMMGMMGDLAKPKAVKWFNLSTDSICFGARDNQFGSFYINAEGFLAAIKLVHVSGEVTCDKSSCANDQAEYNSKWGCATSHPFLGKTPLNTVITSSSNKIVFPKNHLLTHEESNLWYNMEQFDSNSDILVFQRFNDPLYVQERQELRLWYGEDLKDVSENDNGGQTCASVLGLYL